MAKFAKGDKVESVKTGAKGVVDEVYGDEKYAVLFDGAANPDRVEGFQIRLANARARNAKSKVKIFEREGARPIIREYDSLDAARAYAGLEYNQRIAKAPYGSFLIAVIGEDGFYQQLGGERWQRVSPAAIKAANANARSANAVVQNAINARRARNAGIWSSAKEAEDRSDIFVRAALSRVNGRFGDIDNEAGTLRDVIKLLASAEQTPKIKKNTDKLKGILSRVEKASALIKGI